MSDEELIEQVRNLLLANVNQGYSDFLKQDYCYIKPSPVTYPFQWWWDTCFHIFILCSLKKNDLAKRNLKSLFAMQEENGFVGHMIFWESLLPDHILTFLQSKPTLDQIRPHMSAIIQPPLAAQALLRIYQNTQDKTFLNEMLPKIEKHHKWLADNRDFDHDGLLSIISPFESGMDWKASFDPIVGFPHGLADDRLYRKVLEIEFKNFIFGYDLPKIYQNSYFVVKEVLFNTIYIQDLYALAELLQEVDKKKSDYFLQRAKKATKRILEIMYDEETKAFYDVYGKKDQQIKIITATIFFPIVLPEIPPNISNQVVENHLLNESEFKTPFPIPSVSKTDKSFYPYETDFLWRGPTWVIFNWFLYGCLSEDFPEEARNLLFTVKKLINKGGFREYYNPFTGEGYGAKDFTWSGLVVDMMRMGGK